MHKKSIFMLLTVVIAVMIGASSASALWIPNTPIYRGAAVIHSTNNSSQPDWGDLIREGANGNWDPLIEECIAEGCEVLECDVTIVCGDNGEGDNITLTGGIGPDGEPTDVIVVKPKPSQHAGIVTLFELTYAWQDDDPGPGGGGGGTDACNSGGEWPNCATQCLITSNNCDYESAGDVDWFWVCSWIGSTSCADHGYGRPGG